MTSLGSYVFCHICWHYLIPRPVFGGPPVDIILVLFKYWKLEENFYFPGNLEIVVLLDI